MNVSINDRIVEAIKEVAPDFEPSVFVQSAVREKLTRMRRISQADDIPRLTSEIIQRMTQETVKGE